VDLLKKRFVERVSNGMGWWLGRGMMGFREWLGRGIIRISRSGSGEE
jgi:hypothetical protein